MTDKKAHQYTEFWITDIQRAFNEEGVAVSRRLEDFPFGYLPGTTCIILIHPEIYASRKVKIEQTKIPVFEMGGGGKMLPPPLIS